MREFTAYLYTPLPSAEVVALLGATGVAGVVLPEPGGSTVIAAWEDWERVLTLCPEAWSVAYEADGPSLKVEGWRGGSCWLSLSFEAENTFDWDDLLDEDGRMPDGSAPPERGPESSLQSVQAAAEAGALTPALAAWLRRGLEGRVGTRQVMKLLPGRLGLSARRWIGPDDLSWRSAEDWRALEPSALIVP